MRICKKAFAFAIELFPFQQKALADLRAKAAEALLQLPQALSFAAPAGAGKTIVMAALVEGILRGDDAFGEQRNAVIVWLSGSPQPNEQPRPKIEAKADRIGFVPCETVSEESLRHGNL